MFFIPCLQCPGCNQNLVPNSEMQSVVCPSCSKAKRRVFRFCWDCQREWPHSASPNSTCAQLKCAIRAALLSDKRISDPDSLANGCPYFRACPKCNALLTHNGIGCPNITCPECFTEFCFRCLRTNCFGIALNIFGLLRRRYLLNEADQCTIVENSQSLLALR